MRTLVVGTRGSPLALAQTQLVCASLQKADPQLTIQTRVIKTTGDIFGEASLEQTGGRGLFTREIEEQLLAGKIQVAVHSLKDMPTELPDGLVLAAVTERVDPGDALISPQYKTLDRLPANAKVGTSSLRRKAQLLNVRPDLTIVDLRGNLDTRLKKLATEQLDAI
ncbi:MAG: hydroxymethylbilane synthase, partial [Verrucomicrobiae bacterium]|nr:hydroxymethylbilane synthase [Verrucomicrobiae bacterium]